MPDDCIATNTSSNCIAHMITVTAIIPNYNHGAKIGRAIESLLRQVVPPDEIVIVDDASTDDSIGQIEPYLGSQVSRLRLIRHKENLGAIAAINTGIHSASCSHVVFVAADDVTKPNMIEVLRSALLRFPEAKFASGEIRLKNDDGVDIGLRPPSRPSLTTRYFDRQETADLFRRIDNFILTGASLFELSVIREAGELKSNLGPFADGFLVRQLAFRHGIVFVPASLAEWHVSNTGLSRSAALSATRTLQQMDAATRAFSQEAGIPEWYWPLYQKRWCFAVLRIALKSGEGAEIIETYAPGRGNAKRLFMEVSKCGSIGVFLCLVWAALTYRPTSFWMLFLTWISRKRWFGKIQKMSQSGDTRLLRSG